MHFRSRYFFIIPFLLLFTGCINLKDCGSSTECFLGKISKCEQGAQLSSEKPNDGPWYVEIAGEKDGQCTLHYFVCDPEKSASSCSMFWDEDDLSKYVCHVSDFEKAKDPPSLQWLEEHIQEGDRSSPRSYSACFYLGVKLAGNRQFFS